jgi:hypothetical protein
MQGERSQKDAAPGHVEVQSLAPCRICKGQRLTNLFPTIHPSGRSREDFCSILAADTENHRKARDGKTREGKTCCTMPPATRRAVRNATNLLTAPPDEAAIFIAARRPH